MNRKSRRALPSKQLTDISLPVRHAASVGVLTMLVTTTMLVASTDAYALCTSPLSGTINTQCGFGDTDITVTSGTTINYAGGGGAIYTTGAYGHSFINNGTITTGNGASSGTGVWVQGDLLNAGTLTNNGSITVNNTAGGGAWDIYVNNVHGTITNNGTLTAISTNTAGNAGVAALELTASVDGAVANNGTITASATATNGHAIAKSVDVGSNMNGTLTNGGTISSTAHATNSYASAYGIYVNNNMGGTLTNSGTLTANATSTHDESFAYGIDIGGNITGILSNTNAISVTANAAQSEANAYGIRAANVTSDGTLINSGTIEVNASGHSGYAHGIAATNLAGSLTNTGTLTITSHANTSSGTATGMAVSNSITGTLTNSGTINVTANGVFENLHAWGITVGGVGANGVVNNTGTVNVASNGSHSHNYAYGIYSSGDVDGTLTNSGTVTVGATNVHADADASGIYIDGAVNHDISNSGTIKVTTTTPNHSGSAKGFYIQGDLNNTLINSGTLTVTGNASSGYVSAYGIRHNGTLNGSIVNSGTMTVTGNAPGMEVYGISAQTVANGGSISNTGTLTINANGTNSAYAVGIGAVTLDSGGTITNKGTVTVNDSLYPATGYSVQVLGGGGTLDNSGTLTGNLSLGGTVSMTNSGTVNLPSAAHGGNSAAIGGNYTGSGSGLINFGVASNANYATLSIAGTADFTNGNNLRATFEPGNTYAGATLTDVITSGTLVHPNGFTVTDNSLAYNFAAQISGNNVSLVPTATGLTTVTAAVHATGLSSGDGLAALLDNWFTNGAPSAGLQNILDTIGSASSNQQLSNDVAELLPLMSGGTTQVTLDMMHTVDHIVQSRLESDSGLSSGDNMITSRSAWFKPFGSWTSQSDRGGVSGYDATTYGAVLGADGLLANNKTRLGLAGVWSHSNVGSNSDVAPQNDHIDSYQGIVYGTYSLNDRTDVSFQGDVGYNNNDGTRYVGIASANAYSRYNSWSEHASAGISRKYELGSQTLLLPSLRADFANITTQSYTETGNSGANLHVKGDSTQELIFSAGGKVLRPLNDSLKITANAGIGYDVLNQQASISSNFVGGGATFVANGIKQSPWIGQAGLGLIVDHFHNVEVTARYDLEARPDFTEQTASLKFRLPF